MILRVFGHSFHYECENLCRVFFPNEKISILYDNSGEESKEVITVYDNGEITVTANIDGASKTLTSNASYENAELEIARLIFFILCDITSYTPSWGVLTGVRPSKLMMKLISEDGEEEAKRYFTERLLVSEEKTNLTYTVANAESGIVNTATPESFSLYVSIPFCPTRCSYCSFVSHSISSPAAKKMIIPYVDNLVSEIKLSSDYARSLGLKLESIYFGGGTPGILEPAQFDTIQSTIEECFDLSYLREYTVEIGRPDTVTPEKLNVLKLHNVDRISINPQTFSQKTLDIIGRKHTPEDTVKAYRLAKSYGFRCINMDLIAGLPGEKLPDFSDSLDTCISLSPENITVHTLALKRSSEMNYEGETVSDGKEAEKMLAYAKDRLTNSGYSPYYMYRQSKCVGNLENVGWTKPGHEGFYNVIMMEECHTVIGVGAGAVTKLCEPGGTNVERIFNYKFPYEYISGFDVIRDRKKGIADFYNSLKSPGKDEV